jgi:hypothetical protein
MIIDQYLTVKINNGELIKMINKRLIIYIKCSKKNKFQVRRKSNKKI